MSPRIVKEQIYITQSNMHILNSAANKAVFSGNTIVHGSDYNDFLRNHIYRLFSDDAVKLTSFTAESAVKDLLGGYASEKFVQVSRNLATMLYDIMENNVGIPSADLIVTEFSVEQNQYLAILKFNYADIYGHVSDDGDVDILMHKDMIPPTGKLKEAAVVDLSSWLVRVAEKPYEIDGEKENYFSERFLMCCNEKSNASKVRVLNKIIDRVQTGADKDTPQEKIRVKDAAARKLEENESISFKDVPEIFFEDEEEKKAAEDLITRLDMEGEQVAPISESTVKRLTTQELVTESGIRIIIPLLDSRNIDNVAFSYDNGGSIIIKNVGQIVCK